MFDDVDMWVWEFTTGELRGMTLQQTLMVSAKTRALITEYEQYAIEVPPTLKDYQQKLEREIRWKV